MKTKWVSAFLAFFLGGFGIHKFYLWKNIQWFIYLLFFWTYIPALFALIDFFVILTTSQQDFDNQYNKVS
jgi:TM2 domain-containing membrane protein YozV